MRRLLKIGILIFILFSGINFASTFTDLPKITFASMGSTGGGGSNSSGGSYSGGGSSGSSSSYDGDDDALSNPYIMVLGVIGIGVYFFVVLLDRNRFYKLEKHLYKKYDSIFLLKLGSPTNDHTAPADYALELFSPNLTIKQFENALEKLNIKLISNSENDIDENISAKLAEVYTQAQFLYSQLLREKYVDKKYKLNDLKKYLDDIYYKAMVKEIKLKVSQGTIDETIVDDVKISKYAKLDNSLILVKLDVIGQDKEIQFNEAFEDSFDRNEWSDYVIFGKDEDEQYKIIALVYGEHFHLNGKDFNHQEGLSKAKYTEKQS